MPLLSPGLPAIKRCSDCGPAPLIYCTAFSFLQAYSLLFIAEFSFSFFFMQKYSSIFRKRDTVHITFKFDKLSTMAILE